MVLLFAGLAWFLSRSGMLHLAADTLLSILLIGIGAGLLITRRSGRRFWPILLGGIVLFVLMGSSASARVHWGDGGQSTFTPKAPADLQRPYQLGAGQMRLDLTKMAIQGNVQVQAKVGAGQLEVIVPPNIPLTVRYQEGVGGIEVEGHELGNGFFSDGTWPSADRRTTGRQLVLDLQVGAGHIDVTTGGPPTPPSAPKAPSPPGPSQGQPT